VANGKVYLRTPFRKMYLPAAAGDAGGAIGAACVVQSRLDDAEDGRSKMGDQPAASHLPSSISQLPRRFHLETAYLGPHFTDDEIGQLLEGRGLLDSADCSHGSMSRAEEEERVSQRRGYNFELLVSHIDDDDELCQRTARAIAEGLVVGWFQGRMEWGPRALGNRSILCDPRRADMKDILNAKIKRRESFRPFAPSILREAVAEWFEQEDDVPFMMQVFQVREEKRALIPAVTHVDGSGRLQTVHRETNPLYHQLISNFCSLTFVPLVLNTSFNENEPVVCRPEEALDCFLRTKMDVLVLENYFVQRTQ